MKANILFGNILSARGIIVQGCNSQGVMGSGLAKDIREKWPLVFDVYADHLKSKDFNSGTVLGDIIPFLPSNQDAIIMNCITQEFYGRDTNIKYVSYKAIDIAFRKIYRWINEAKAAGVLSCLDINYPLIGAGLANGDWSVISAIIDNVASEEDPGNYIKRTLWIKE
jgi:O-acetyl-ADP-ribose deacetylase (regulator of RNase III)